ncbi:formate/nitrite transporter family protein [Desulfosporosinus nitroreducens]|uniref:Formate/nitrite transporter family protein n=1 Tax=Desulfosporosinus nitroreducens TaxID=2018668 RepID=A0ABT8QUH0_9FIRM|nr:formate/nitrite transporter family protein [Desulfosporosinus nitroreducens]MCO1602740.1 formate/nitrite transporter family protein [Desulfosporosinus nitroreducens]MDO0825009.1 formate/nitrite transporter family protein [Desulfosporosinus nitroreducens]
MEQRPMNTVEAVEETIKVGENKAAKTHTFQTLIAGILAGTFIALGAFAAAMASHGMENIGLAKLVAGTIFPVGLILIVICGGELFTGNTLLILAFIEKKITARQMLRNWIIVYIGNFIGTLLIAFLVFNSGLLSTNEGMLGGYALKVAAYKGGLTFIQAFSSGILCNLLVCLAVWGSYTASDVFGKILIIWFPVMTFIVSGFEHSVANMYYFTIAALAKLNSTFIEAAHIGDQIANINLVHILSNIIPVTLGNIVGGAFFVGLAYWAGYKYIPNLYKLEKGASKQKYKAQFRRIRSHLSGK